MKKRIIFLWALLWMGSVQSLWATHIVGAEIFYECLDPLTNTYRITLKLYRDCLAGQAPFDNEILLFAFSSRTGQPVRYITLNVPLNTPEIEPEAWDACVGRPYNICVQEGVYSTTATLPPVEGGYDLAWARCCRNQAISNIRNPLGQGITFLAHMPDPRDAPCNSMPVYGQFPPIFLCANEKFSFDHSAEDKDGDSLSYAITNPFTGLNINGLGAGNPQQGGNQPSVNRFQNPMGPPPYQNVNFNPGYKFDDPFGSGDFNIDPETGFITVTPRNTGIFVYSISVFEWRDGKLLSENRRDYQIHIIACKEQGEPPVITHNFGNLPNRNDTLFVEAGEPFCYDVLVRDPIASDVVGAFPVSAAFGRGFFFSPRATFAYTGRNPIQGQVCWEPACQYDGQVVPLILGARDLSDCPNISEVFDTVWVKVDIPDNTLPEIRTDAGALTRIGDTIYVEADKDFCVDVAITDADLDPLSAFALGDVFNERTPPTFTFSGDQALQGQLCWTPGCQYEDQVFPVTIGASDLNLCDRQDSVTKTLFVKVVVPANNPPALRFDLSEQEFNGDTLRVFADQDFCLSFEATDPDLADVLSIIPDGTLFDSTGVQPLLSFGGANPLQGELCWEAPCEWIGQTLPLTLGVSDDASCSSRAFSNRTLYLSIQQAPNIAPRASHDLRGNVTRGDTILLLPQESLSYRFAFQDDNVIDSLVLTPLSTAFEGDSTLSLTFEGRNPIEGEVSWTPGCEYAGQVVPLLLQASDNGPCDNSLNAIDTVYVQVTPQALLAPQVEHDLTGNVFSGDTIFIDEEESLCYRFLVSDLTDFTGVDYTFEFLKMDGTSIGLGNADVVRANNSIRGEICFNSDCTNGGSLYQLVVTGQDRGICAPFPETRDTVYVKVNTEFVVSSGPDLEVCEGAGGAALQVTPLGGSGPYTYSWGCVDDPDCGIGNVNARNPRVNPSGTTTYFVQVTDNFGCTSELDSIEVRVNPLPRVDAGADAFICEGENSVQLAARVLNADEIPPGYTFEWLPAAGLSDPTLPDPVATPDTNTIYTVVVRSPNGCNSEPTTLDTLSTVAVSFQPSPRVNAGPDLEVCIGDSVQLAGFATGGPGPYDYSWQSMGILSDPSDATPFVAPTSDTEYVLTASANGCPGDTDTVRVRVNPLPGRLAGDVYTACAGDTVLLDGTATGGAGGYTYTWLPRQGLSDPASATPAAAWDSSLTYQVSVSDRKGCRSSYPVNFNVLPTPLAAARVDTAICEGDTVALEGRFSVIGGGADIRGVLTLWRARSDEGAGQAVGSDSLLIVSPRVSTLYEYTATLGQCSSTDRVKVDVFPAITAQAGPKDTLICSGESVLLAGSGGAGDARFVWRDADGTLVSGAATASVAPAQTTTYWLSVEENGCDDRDSVQVNVKPSPTLAYEASAQDLCLGQEMAFTAIYSNADSLLWDFGDGTYGRNNPSPVHRFDSAGTYPIGMTVFGTNGCATHSNELVINVYPDAVAAFDSDPPPGEDIVTPDPAIAFFNQSENGVTYQWDFGDGSGSTEANPEHVYAGLGSYPVTLVATNAAGCSDTLQRLYTVADPSLFIPNVFTPNGDGNHDRFVVEYNGKEACRLDIFDRWGRRMFSSASYPPDGWDGTTEAGNDAPEGVYFYRMEVGNATYDGSLTLMR